MTPKKSNSTSNHPSHQNAAHTHGPHSGDAHDGYGKQDSHEHEPHSTQAVAARDTRGYQKTLLFSFIIITSYMFIEAIGGWLTGSLALLSDAGHMLSDAIALGVTLMAFKIGEKSATHQKTFGYKRFEILVATVNGATLIVIALMIFYEAIKRFNSPPEIATQGMLIVAIVGMLINILVAWLMHRSQHNDSDHTHSHGKDDTQSSNKKEAVNLNMHSAYLHVLSDLMGSVAAIIAALLMMGFGWVWADALASVIVAVLILVSGYRVVRNSVHILMEGTPSHISLVEIEQTLQQDPQVKEVHDLHVWSITSGLNALSCHVTVDGDMSIHDSSILIANLEQRLLALDIHHATIQVESSSHPQTQAHSSALVCNISERTEAMDSHMGHHH